MSGARGEPAPCPLSTIGSRRRASGAWSSSCCLSPFLRSCSMSSWTASLPWSWSSAVRWSWSIASVRRSWCVVVAAPVPPALCFRPDGAVVVGGAPSCPTPGSPGPAFPADALDGPAGGVRSGDVPPSRTESTESSSPSIPRAHAPTPSRCEAAASWTLVGERVDVVEEDLVPLPARLVRRPRGLGRRVPVGRARSHGLRVGHRLRGTRGAVAQVRTAGRFVVAEEREARG